MKKAKLSEIVKETGKEIYQEFNRDIFSPVGNALYKGSKFTGNLAKDVASGLKNVVYMTIFLNVAVYALPTLKRKILEYDIVKQTEEHNSYINDTDAEEPIGACLGMVGMIGQICFYADKLRNGHPEYLLIPVVTNLASAVYEKSRKVKERLESTQ